MRSSAEGVMLRGLPLYSILAGWHLGGTCSFSTENASRSRTRMMAAGRVFHLRSDHMYSA